MNDFNIADTETLWSKLKKDSSGLVPVITQDYLTHEVLMLAYMNEESLLETISTGFAHYYSRSRKSQWFKGETSGHVQRVKKILVDCDCDTVLLLVEQSGSACHTGSISCFYRDLRDI